MSTDEQFSSDAIASSSISNVQLKLPPFWPNDPTIWFTQVEAQFLTKGISKQSTKFAYIVASLEPEYAQEIRDLLISPPKENPYDVLKYQLIQRTSASEQKRLHQLLISEELGDRKPSQLLRKMKQLLGTNTLEENILKQLFLQRLPTNIQVILASTRDSMEIEKLADLADKILETHSPIHHSQVAHLSPSSSSATPSSNPEMAEMKAQIAQLSLLVQNLSAQQTDRSRGRSRERGSRQKESRQRSKSPQSHVGGDCYYHWRFGKGAKKCTPPCTFKQTNQGNDKASD
ncbi:uncharacterized protein LOC121430256 [Lytechinus variegatus]|uniref:uncharacterized protein LOC121430256 n=1 Tax=Lytechinus variegatus TaxID=7654 RepID=UPI001BB2A3EA|nr:uncharacterized protein LOC121430256 [Lytechinus variegatus]